MSSSSERLTKYKNATTVVTADIANSWFGGLYGSTEATNLEDDDPRVVGHVHDGQHLDGHSGKVDLVDHVDGQLRNSNLADEAVTSRNIQTFTSVGSAIPEYEVVNGTTYYYLDLSTIRDEIGDSGATVFEHDDTNDAIHMDIAFGPAYSTTDFVFGSPTIAYTGNTNHANRMVFDKSNGSFRAGTDTSTGFINANVGLNSFAVGINTFASGDRSFAFGRESVASGNYSMAFGEYAVATANGQIAYSNGKFSTNGDSQRSTYNLRTEFTAGGAANDAILKLNDGTQIELENNSVYYFSLFSLIKCTTTNQEQFETFDFMCRRGASAADVTVTYDTGTGLVYGTTYGGAVIQIAATIVLGKLVILMAGGTAGHVFKWIGKLDALKISI